MLNIKLAYLNTQGLDQPKLAFCQALLDTYDFVVIAEHWFPQGIDLDSLPNLIASSAPSHYRDVGHQNDGILVLARDKWVKETVVLHASPFTITFKVCGQVFTCAYLPPRLDNVTNRRDPSLEQVLNQIPQHSATLFGDLNFRLGARNGDRTITAKHRLPLILERLPHLTLVGNESDVCSRTDHVLSSIPCSFMYYSLTGFLKSDHGLMSITFNLPDTPLREASKLPQFDFSPLRDPLIGNAMSAHYDTNMATSVSQALEVLDETLSNCEDYKERVTVVDAVYSFYNDVLINLCKTFFKEYDPRTPHHVQTDKFNRSNKEAIRAFKRAQKMRQMANPVIPNTPGHDPLDDAFTHFDELYNSSVTGFDEPAPDPINWDPDDATYITEAELRNLIRKYPSHRSGGPDALHTRLFKALLSSRYYLPHLHQLFQLFFSHGVTPTSWNVATMHLLPKDPNDPRVSKCRPISLTCILRRFFESSILRSMQQLPGLADFAVNQAGFRHGYSTISQLLMSDHLSKSRSPITVFLDMKAAYDTVPHAKLLQTSHFGGCPPRYLSLIHSLMIRDSKAWITVNRDRHPNLLKRTRGLFQGSVLSPFLFLIYIDQLARFSDKILLFADDIALKAQTTEQAQELLNACQEWSQSHGMTWNLAKCGVVGTDVPLLLGTECVPRVNQYKYLGVPHNSEGLMWDSYIRDKIIAHNRFLMANMNARRNWSMKQRLIIGKTFASPILDYAAGCWSTWLTRQLDHVREGYKDMLYEAHTLFLDFVFNASDKVALLTSMAGLSTVELRLEHWRASMAYQYSRLAQDNPLRSIQATPDVLNNRNYICNSVHHSPVLLDWREHNQNLPRNQKTSWSTWLRKRRIASALSLDGILQFYILPCARGPSGTDRALMADSRITQDKIFNWRMNRSFINKRCVCGSAYSRNHIERCGLLDGDPEIHEILTSEEYQIGRQDFIEHVRAYRPRFKASDSNYNIMDYLLNRKPALFHRAYDLISLRLT